MSDGEDDLGAEAVAVLADPDGDASDERRREVAREVGRAALQGGRFHDRSDLDPDVTVDLVDALDDDDPLVRGHVAAALAHLGPHVQEDPDPEATERVLFALFEAAADEDPAVRQTAMLPVAWAAIKGIVGTGDDGDPAAVGVVEDDVVAAIDVEAVAREAASVAVERLADERDLVRKRAAGALVSRGSFPYLAHDAELFLAHPDPEAALDVVLDGLADPVEETPTMYHHRRAWSVRDAAGNVVVALASHDPDLLASRAGRLRDALDGEFADARRDAALGLALLAGHDPGVVDGVVDDVVGVVGEALRQRALNRDAIWGDAADALVALALARPGDADAVAAALVAGLTDRRTQVRATSADGIVRLVEGAPAGFEPDPPLRAIAAASPADGFLEAAPRSMKNADGYVDPLVAVAGDHLDFAADRLRGLEEYFVGDRGWEGYGCDALFSAIADVDPAAVEPGIETALDAVRRGSAKERPERTLAGLARDHPDLVAPVVEDLIAAAALDEAEPKGSGPASLPASASRAVESAAPALGGISGATVATLVEDGLGSPDDNERLRAARALGALSRESLLPEDAPEIGAAAGRLADVLAAGEFDAGHRNNTSGADEPLAVLARSHPAVATAALERVTDRAPVARASWGVEMLVEEVQEANPTVVEHLGIDV